MMRFLMIILLVSGLFYLYRSNHRPPPPPPPPPPPALNMQPTPALTAQDVERVRESTHDADPSVRWAAIELLYHMHDPQAIGILENMLALDSESSVRRNALHILQQSPKPTAVKDLLLALKDQETDIRVAALMALGEMGDPKIAPYIADLVNDPEPSVRLQALHTLGHIQEHKATEYRTVADKLRAEYEAILHRSQANNSGNIMPTIGQRRDVAQPN